jgi:uncharacterized protein (UPF0332 family)
MVARLLDLADQLIDEGANSSALRRRAVSTAYYAVFHALAKSCTNALLQSIDRDSETYERVYRALDHGTLKNVFAAQGSPLRDREPLRAVGNLVIKLQSERHKADYLPPTHRPFSVEDAQELVEQARIAVRRIERLDEQDRVALAAWLLFRNRQP